MDSDLLRIISAEIRETKMLTLETRRMANETREEARAAMKRADAAWDLVVITRSQVNKEIEYLKYLRLPWWKKVLGDQPN